MTHSKHNSNLFVLALLSLIPPTMASAGGLDLPTLSADQQGTSNANTAEADNPTVIFYNPAGMVRLPGINVSNSVSLLTLSGREADLGTTITPGPTQTPNPGNQPAGAPATNTTGTLNSFWPKLLGAGGLAATAQVSDTVFAGLGVFASGGGKINFPYNSPASNFVNSANIEAININPSLAIRLDAQHSFGIGLSAIVAHSSEKLQIDMPGTLPYLLTPFVQSFNPSVSGIAGSTAANAGLPTSLSNFLKQLNITLPVGSLSGTLSPAQQQQLSSLLGSVLVDPSSTGSGRIGMLGVGFGYNLGYMFQYDAKTRFSLAYRSESKVRMHGDLNWDLGNVRSTVPVPDPNTGQLLTAEEYFQRYFRPNTDANSTLDLPARLSVSAFHALTDKVDVMADYTFIQTSVDKDLNITFANQYGGAYGTSLIQQGPANVHLNWRNSFKASFGMNYHVNDQLTLRTGFQFDRSPVPDAQDRFPGGPDSNRSMYSVGAGYKVNKTTSLDFAYSYIRLADSMSDYHSYCRGTYQEQDNTLSTDPASCTGNGGTFMGTFYDTRIQILSAQASKRF